VTAQNSDLNFLDINFILFIQKYKRVHYRKVHVSLIIQEESKYQLRCLDSSHIHWSTLEISIEVHVSLQVESVSP
jgi:hypothetical protein